jgi:ATP-dependent DNA helicase RecG
MPAESQHLEYKSELTGSLEREVVGFLNSREGGRILIGVDDMGTISDLERVEHLGSGMPRILKAYPRSSFRFTENFIRMSLPASEKIFGESKVKTSEKTSVKTSEKTSEKILRMIRDDNQITIAMLSQNIGISTRSIERNLKNLQDQGALIRHGPDKGGHWEILG